jgi:hypothetical protein
MNLLKDSYYFNNIGLKNTQINKEKCEVIYSGVFNIIKIDKENKNGRIYDRTAVLKMIQLFSSLSYCYGCVDTVIHNFRNDILTPETSHIVKYMWIEDDILKAHIDILDTMGGKKIIDSAKKNELGFATASIATVDYSTKVVEIERFITLYAVLKDDMCYDFDEFVL